ncbi:MAG: transcription antitermination factor NusB [Gammaproteobacteria bacterium]|nr:transcription antitermination factor NusB [Gammaproteobacteria bacterium]
MSTAESKYPAGFIKKRKHARDKAMQALYQLTVSKEEIDWVRDHYLNDQGVASGDEEYFLELLYKVHQNVAEIDAAFTVYVTSMENNLDPIEESILRIATYEFMHHLEIPFKVVINEAVNLARTYGTDESHKFVNGVLDPLAKKLRPLEVSATK